MKVIDLSPQEDTQAWQDLRRDKITSTRVKFIKPLSRGTDRTPEGFWQMLADRLAVPRDGEDEKERGLRLEREAIELTEKKLKLKLNYEPGFWISDLDEDIAVTPDAAEKGTPTYAVEAKCLASKNHLKAVILDQRARKGDYFPLDSLKIAYNLDFSFQAIQYFVVNEKLKALYFTLYDDRVVLDSLAHHVITIERSQVGEQIREQLEMELDVLKQVRELIKEVKNV